MIITGACWAHCMVKVICIHSNSGCCGIPPRIKGWLMHPTTIPQLFRLAFVNVCVNVCVCVRERETDNLLCYLHIVQWCIPVFALLICSCQTWRESLHSLAPLQKLLSPPAETSRKRLDTGPIILARTKKADFLCIQINTGDGILWAG